MQSASPIKRHRRRRSPLESPSLLTDELRSVRNRKMSLPVLTSTAAKRGATVPFSLTWNGGETSGLFFPGVYTGKFLREMEDEDIWVPVSRLLAEWNYTLGEDDPDVPEDLRGKVCPTDEQSLSEYAPIPYLRAVYSAIMRTMRNPNPETPPE